MDLFVALVGAVFVAAAGQAEGSHSAPSPNPVLATVGVRAVSGIFDAVTDPPDRPGKGLVGIFAIALSVICAGMLRGKPKERSQ